MAYYRHHVFFCCNQRDHGRLCCNAKGASGRRDYAKRRVKEPSLAGGVRSSRADVDEIIEERLTSGRAVARLRI